MIGEDLYLTIIQNYSQIIAVLGSILAIIEVIVRLIKKKPVIDNLVTIFFTNIIASLGLVAGVKIMLLTFQIVGQDVDVLVGIFVGGGVIFLSTLKQYLKNYLKD